MSFVLLRIKNSPNVHEVNEHMGFMHTETLASIYKTDRWNCTAEFQKLYAQRGCKIVQNPLAESIGGAPGKQNFGQKTVYKEI